MRHSSTRTFGSTPADEPPKRKSTTSSSKTSSLYANSTPTSTSTASNNSHPSTRSTQPTSHFPPPAAAPTHHAANLSYSSIPYQHSHSIPTPDFSSSKLHGDDKDDLDDMFSICSSISADSTAPHFKSSNTYTVPIPEHKEAPAATAPLPEWAGERMIRYYQKIYNNSLAGVASDLQTLLGSNGKMISFKAKQQMVTIPTAEHDAIVLQGLKAHRDLIFNPSFNGKPVFWHKDASIPVSWKVTTPVDTSAPVRSTKLPPQPSKVVASPVLSKPNNDLAATQDSLKYAAMHDFAAQLLAGDHQHSNSSGSSVISDSQSLDLRSVASEGSLEDSEDDAEMKYIRDLLLRQDRMSFYPFRDERDQVWLQKIFDYMTAHPEGQAYNLGYQSDSAMPTQTTAFKAFEYQTADGMRLVVSRGFKSKHLKLLFPPPITTDKDGALLTPDLMSKDDIIAYCRLKMKKLMLDQRFKTYASMDKDVQYRGYRWFLANWTPYHPALHQELAKNATATPVTAAASSFSTAPTAGPRALFPSDLGSVSSVESGSSSSQGMSAVLSSSLLTGTVHTVRPNSVHSTSSLGATRLEMSGDVLQQRGEAYGEDFLGIHDYLSTAGTSTGNSSGSSGGSGSSARVGSAMGNSVMAPLHRSTGSTGSRQQLPNPAANTSTSLSSLTISTMNRTTDSAQQSGSSSSGSAINDTSTNILFKLYGQSSLTIMSNISSSSSLPTQLLLSATSTNTVNSSSDVGNRSGRNVIFVFEDLSVSTDHTSQARKEVLRGILQHSQVTRQKKTIRILVSPPFFHQQHQFYTSLSAEANTTVQVFPLLLSWQHMSIRSLWQLLRFSQVTASSKKNEESMFNIALHSLLQQYQRQSRTFVYEDLSYTQFLQDLQKRCQSFEELSLDLVYARFALLEEVILESNSNSGMFSDAATYTEYLHRAANASEDLVVLVDLSDPMLRRDTVCILYSMVLRQLSNMESTTRVLLQHVDSLLMFSAASSSGTSGSGSRSEKDDFQVGGAGHGSGTAAEELLGQINALVTQQASLQLTISCSNPTLLPVDLWQSASLVLLYQHSLQRMAVRAVQESLQLSAGAIRKWTTTTVQQDASNNSEDTVCVHVENLKLKNALSAEEQELLQAQELDGLLSVVLRPSLSC